MGEWSDMRRKTYKLKTLENNRFSIMVTDLKHCYFCGKSPVDIHEVYGGANRRVSMKNGFCVPLCRSCHQQITTNNTLSSLLKASCQRCFEINHTKEEFLQLIGKYYDID